MTIPLSPVFQGVGEKPGQRLSAEFVGEIQRRFSSDLIAVADPLIMESGPGGNLIGVERSTLDIRRFVLTADLESGSSATANLLAFDGSTTSQQGEEITVYDALGAADGSIVGRSGDYGLAKYHPDSGRLELVRSALLSSGEDWFCAKITSRASSGGVWLYGWEEQEFATKSALPTALSGGRSGDDSSKQPAIEINNQKVPLNTYVWMRRGYRGNRAVASITKTASGNNYGTASAFSVYVRYAYGGTYTLTLNGGTTSALAYNAASGTVKSALESASGLTLSSFSGAGTYASPWTFTVTTDAGDYFASADGGALVDDSSYAFAAPAGTAQTYEWVEKSSDYNPAVGEAVRFDYSGGDCNCKLPADAEVNDRVLIYPIQDVGSGVLNKVILKSTLSDGSSYLLNGATAVDKNLGVSYATYSGGYEFICQKAKDGDPAEWVCLRPLTDNSSGEFQAFCRVSSLTSTTSGNGTPNVYPGWTIAWDTGSFFWGDQGECWIIEINGGTPSLQNYLGSSVDYDSIDGKPILTIGG